MRTAPQAEAPRGCAVRSRRRARGRCVSHETEPQDSKHLARRGPGGGPPNVPSLPGSQEITDGVPGTDEHLGLVAPEDGGLVGRNLNVSVYLHGFRMIICHGKTRKEHVAGRTGWGGRCSGTLHFRNSSSPRDARQLTSAVGTESQPLRNLTKHATFLLRQFLHWAEESKVTRSLQAGPGSRLPAIGTGADARARPRLSVERDASCGEHLSQAPPLYPDAAPIGGPHRSVRMSATPEPASKHRRILGIQRLVFIGASFVHDVPSRAPIGVPRRRCRLSQGDT